MYLEIIITDRAISHSPKRATLPYLRNCTVGGRAISSTEYMLSTAIINC